MPMAESVALPIAAPTVTLMVVPLALLVVAQMANLTFAETAVQAASIAVLVDVLIVATMNMPPILNCSLGLVL